LVYDNRAELTKLNELASKFKKALAEYKERQKEGMILGHIQSAKTKIRSHEVSVGEVKDFPVNAETAKYQQSHTGKVDVRVSPFQRIHLKPATGIVYSFVKNPTYSVSTDADGKITVKEVSNDYNEFAGAVGINLYPDRYVGEPIEPFVQVEYSPTSKQQGFLLGFGFTGFDNFHLSTGVIFQERRELGIGLSVGSVLAKAEDLKVDTSYKAGLYVQIGIDF
jgi:hypothetical protein